MLSCTITSRSWASSSGVFIACVALISCSFLNERCVVPYRTSEWWESSLMRSARFEVLIKRGGMSGCKDIKRRAGPPPSATFSYSSIDKLMVQSRNRNHSVCNCNYSSPDNDYNVNNPFTLYRAGTPQSHWHHPSLLLPYINSFGFPASLRS